MNMKFKYRSETLRSGSADPAQILCQRFKGLCGAPHDADALFIDASHGQVVGWSGLKPWRPLMRSVLNNPEILDFVRRTLGQEGDGLFFERNGSVAMAKLSGGKTEEIRIPESVGARLLDLRRGSDQWVGVLTDEGDYVFDPRTPTPGTHFRANLLIGDRFGFPDPLLTTPKAVVDGWGRGSSRSHADKQILATRWDLLPEENGFPANRQFYLVESGRQIFYSAAPSDDTRVQTRHAANHTVMEYEMLDGLRIERAFFVMPAEEELPLGVETQIVRVINSGSRKRDLQLVLTGMFGYIHPGALPVDVIYTCVTVDPQVLHDDSGQGPVLVVPRYTASWNVDDRPFNMSIAFDHVGRLIKPGAFCLDYQKFVGNGSLERPQFIACLDNAYPKKGPAFFALMFPLQIAPGNAVECHSFNGLLSRHEGQSVTDEHVTEKMNDLVAKAVDPEWGRAALRKVREFHESYRQAVQIDTPHAQLNRLFNTHLPFQIRYQTYVSRSFALTQKGFRQIGFREIQDLLAAMFFEVAAGRKDHVRDLIGIWAGHVHRFGYANHQFYWTGVEPGRYSDDALWLFQAVGRFIDLTGDTGILDSEWPVAGEDGSRRRLFDTLLAILKYSGKISIGKNGLPLLDRADWNDTLNLDGEGIHGPQKEVLYRKQIADGVIKEGDPLKSDLSESLMNGFLLEIARAYMVRFSCMKGHRTSEKEWSDFSPVLRERLQKAWKGDFFARCFINRPNEANTMYLGARGDGLSADPSIPGTYFLNSFSWPILSGIATEEQIRTMLGPLESTLMTPFGLRVSSPTKFRLLMPHSGSGDYAYGDRENGGVFKHANMMATVAMIEAARTVSDPALAERLLSMAWRILQLAAPYVAFENPYRLAGNPRFCTQYTNPATHEHIGPLLSGTAPWMWLSYLSMLGVRFHEGRISVDPVLPPEWTTATVNLRVPAGRYRIEIRKPAHFARSKESRITVRMNDRAVGAELPLAPDVEPAQVKIQLG